MSAAISYLYSPPQTKEFFSHSTTDIFSFQPEAETNKILSHEKYLQNEKFWEFEALSIFINDNPFKDIYNYITSFEEVEDGSKGVIIGIVSNIIKKTDRNKKQFAYVSIYSTFGLIDVICWHSQYKEYQDLLKRGNQLALLCKKKDDKAICQSIKTYQQWLKDRNINN